MDPHNCTNLTALIYTYLIKPYLATLNPTVRSDEKFVSEHGMSVQKKSEHAEKSAHAKKV